MRIVTRNTIWRSAAAALCLVLSITSWAWQADDDEFRSSHMRSQSPHSDCSHEPPSRGLTIAIRDPIAGIPEYHDCQELMANSSETDTTLKYVGLVGLFVRHRADTLFANVQRGNILTAVVTIVAYDASYEPLGIARGVNCLALRKSTANPPEWQAVIVPNGRNGVCPDFIPATMYIDSLLQVKAIASGGALDIPSVARWDWDPQRREHYIGVRCERQWCEIGRLGFTSSSSIGIPSDIPSEMQRMYAMKGWYDQQRLAVVENGRAVPRGPWAIIVPHHALGTRDEAAYRAGWQDMSYIYIDGDSYPKMGLLKAELKHGQPARPNVLRARITADGKWLGQIIAPNGRVQKEFAMKYADHSYANLPRVHTARFRWLPEDEDTWVGCLAGCCTKCNTPGGCL